MTFLLATLNILKRIITNNVMDFTIVDDGAIQLDLVLEENGSRLQIQF